MHYDVIIVGAGILGAATARRLLQKFPGKRVLVLDKESRAGAHQTGHNSGVIHAGVYYQPGSLKARFCREGGRQLKAYCAQRDIPVDACGKLIVATDELELARLRGLQRRCAENRIAVEWWHQNSLREREPYISGLAALHVADSAVVDYGAVCEAMLADYRACGGELRLDTEVRQLGENKQSVFLHTSEGDFTANYLICCAGLMADKLASQMGLQCSVRILPFRGEFYRLAPRCEEWISRLVYPVPDPALPFLGVHLTRTLDGGVIAGPNAVLAFQREAYRRSPPGIGDLRELFAFSGFWHLARRHWRSGLREQLDSLYKKRYLRRVQRYCPELTVADLISHPAGVRAQAVDRNGFLLQDFFVLQGRRSLHLINAPSPAATSCIPIANYLLETCGDALSG